MSETDRYYRLGCDIGGTFTDFVLLNDKSGEISVNKCLTTPGDPSDAVEHGIRELDVENKGFVEKLDELIHGTTLVINSIIERKGAVTGLITTKGFRDVLELGREIRYAPYNIFAEFPQPLIPRHLRLEVDERIRSDGTVLKPLKEEDAEKIVKKPMGSIKHQRYLVPFPLVRRQRREFVWHAICLLHGRNLKRDCRQ